jgi:glycosyltransferase involved in cell wall biosynthesis
VAPGPLVSVIVPTYNRAAILPAAITSVLKQTWRNLEVVIIDDGSHDSTRDVVEALAEQDARVRYIHQTNGGVSAARNTGLRKAQGELFAFLDSDDAWLPWKLQAQIAVLNHLPEVGMVWTDMNAVDEQNRLRCRNYLKSMYSAYRRLQGGRLFTNSKPVSDFGVNRESLAGTSVYWGEIYSQMLFGNLVHTSTVVVRRERAEKVGFFDETMKLGGEDYKFHLATTRFGGVAFVDVPAILYRVGADDQITNSKNQVHFARAFLNTLEDELAKHRDEMKLTSRNVAAIRAEAHDWLAVAHIEAGQRGAAAKHAIASLRSSLFATGPYKTLIKSALPRPILSAIRSAKGGLFNAPAASWPINEPLPELNDDAEAKELVEAIV